jgi:hypothetical protein
VKRLAEMSSPGYLIYVDLLCIGISGSLRNIKVNIDIYIEESLIILALFALV